MTTSTGEIRDISFNEALSERYLAYALSTIMSRSLPDVRDGLKPVHRRLLYAMLQLKLDPQSGFKKCARVVGDVIGKYHPHGDVAVYDTLVRLAQSFSVRYPLVEGQGNFGSIDGDNAAAMRYTEARLTEVALALLNDIDSNTVDFRATYDGSEEEPIVLPAAFPNLLANGSEGIAVGMATSIPPHNAGEICDALLHVIKHPNARTEKLCEFIPGPDFPTGGVLVEPHESIINYYDTGKGSFRLRAKWEKENLSHGLYQIVITEIPYQVQKSKLFERIAELFQEKKLALLGNIRDESTEEIRIILEPKNRNVDPAMLMESLFKLTDLEVRISLNMNVIASANVPKVLNLREVLQEFLNHRHIVLLRKSNYRLGKIAARLEILEGLLIAYLNLDKIIKIIREEDEPKKEMMKRFKLTENQAEAILNMRLRQLRKLEEIEIQNEHSTLMKEKQELEALLKDEKLRWSVIASEIKDIKKRFGESTKLGKRRTGFSEAPQLQDISIEAFVEREPITVFCSKMGWVRAVKGHNEDLSDIKYKEGDEERFVVKTHTTDKLLIFASDGRFFTLGCDKIQRGKGQGEAIRIMIDLDENHDLVFMKSHEAQGKLLIASSSGKGFIVKEEDVIAQTRSGRQVLNLAGNETAKIATPAIGDKVAVIGENRKLLIFNIGEIPEMKRGAGVKLQSYKDGGISDAKCFNSKDGLSWNMGGRVRTETNIIEWFGKRSSTGKQPPQGFPKSNRFNR